MVNELAPHDKYGRFIRDYSPASFASASITHLSPSSKYHLYLGNPCPWCHRISIVLALLKSPITKTDLVDYPEKASKGGWYIDPNDPEPLCKAKDLAGVYNKITNNEWTGRCTAPLLVDLTTNTIISNESNEIIRLLNNYVKNENNIDLYPNSKSEEIDEVNEFFYNRLQNGVYRCGFSTSQMAYDEAAADVLEGLRKLEEILSHKIFLVGDQFTEADLKMWPFACRFDGAYSILFRVSVKINYLYRQA